ncbi:MAG: hypothetical protein AB4911_16415 [Oscillochloridaceae bacterium umkhey_bin13]
MVHDAPPPPSWLWPAALLGLAGTLGTALLLLAILDQAVLLLALRIALFALLLGLLGTIGLGLLWLVRQVQRAGVITLQHGQPVDVRDVRRITQATAAATLATHYQVELARAERSGLPALTHYSVRNDGRPASAILDLAPAPPAAPDAAAPDPVPAVLPTDLPQLQAQGMIQPRQLLVGFQGALPAQIDLRSCGFIAVGGQSRSGKSHTVALLVAQAALQGWHIALCDPFPHKPDGLMALCQPLSGAIFRQAGGPDEIARTIQLVDKIGQRRISGEPWDRPLLLVIEEFSNLVIRQSLPSATLDLLPAMAMAYAAVGVHGIIIGHEFSRALLGERLGATLRRACTHRIAHRLTPDAAEFLLPAATFARQVVDLQPGRALLWGDDAPAVISVPKLSRADLVFAAQGRLPRPYQPSAPTLSTPSTPSTPALHPAPSHPPAAPASLDERIVAHLAQQSQPLDSTSIATQLAADIQQVRNALTRLTQVGRIVRHGQPRSYTYSVTGEQ